MSIRVHGADMNAAMRIIKKCVMPKDPKLANVEISNGGDGIDLRATNGNFYASVHVPVMVEEFAPFCVDGTTLASIMAMNANREIEIAAEGQSFVIRGSGRTRIPMLRMHVPEMEAVSGQTITMDAMSFARICEQVKHAIATDMTRIVLTGALVETDGAKMTMTALDGFRLAREMAACEGDAVKAVIPGGFLALVASSVADGEMLELVTDGKAVVAKTPFVTLKCGLLTGEYVDVNRVLPADPGLECLVNRNDVLDALKSANAVVNVEKLVRLVIDGNVMKLSGNSEQADYEAEIACACNDSVRLNVAFNAAYLSNALSTLDTDEIVMTFHGQTAPMVVRRREGEGIRLVLPVRTR